MIVIVTVQTASFSERPFPARVNGDALSVLCQQNATAGTIPTDVETSSIDAVFEEVEGVGVTFVPFVSPCCVEGRGPGVGAFLWGKEKGSNQTFSFDGVVRQNVFPEDVFAEETQSENFLFAFFVQRVNASLASSFFWERGEILVVFLSGRVRTLCVSFSCPVETHFALAPSCDPLKNLLFSFFQATTPLQTRTATVNVCGSDGWLFSWIWAKAVTLPFPLSLSSPLSLLYQAEGQVRVMVMTMKVKVV